MTDEQIFELAKTRGFVGLDDNRMLLCCDDELLKFALAIHENGYNKGYDEGYEMGFEYRDNFDKGYASENSA